MKTLHELENKITQLSEEDYIKFREWFLTHESEKWDAKIEKDIAGGKLSLLANKAVQDFKDGKATAL